MWFVTVMPNKDAAVGRLTLSRSCCRKPRQPQAPLSADVSIPRRQPTMVQSRRKPILILAGNMNVPAFANAIIASTRQLRKSASEELAGAAEVPAATCFARIHAFHTIESLAALAKRGDWNEALLDNGISPTSIVQHTTSIEAEAERSHRDFVEQLESIVDSPLDCEFYVDLTNGVAQQRALLSVLAYVLGTRHIYYLQPTFSTDREERNRQSDMYLHQLEAANVPFEYRRYPSVDIFDSFGRLNLVEVVRYRPLISQLSERLDAQLRQRKEQREPSVRHVEQALLAALRERLVAGVAPDATRLRHAVLSASAGAEESVNLLLTLLCGSDTSGRTLGKKLDELCSWSTSKPGYFVNEKVLRSLTTLMRELRNAAAHADPKANEELEILDVSARLATLLSLSFVQYAVRALQAFADDQGELLDIEVLQRPEPAKRYYFGLDGDLTGDFIATSFEGGGESEIKERSSTIRGALKRLCNVVKKRQGDAGRIVFAEGDNLLFYGPHDPGLLTELQETFQKATGLASSIGFGATPKEASLALRLAKAQNGNSVVGVRIPEREFNQDANQALQTDRASRGV